MSKQFVENVWLTTETCCACHMVFAMTSDFERARREDRKTFYCPAGHQQHYIGLSESDKLRNELKRKEEELNAAQSRALKAQATLSNVAKAHHKMRQRVMNGVCPCCNRSFENLRNHMKTEHSDFGQDRTMLAVRQAFGMTQADVASEAGVVPPHVSLFERGKPVSQRAKKRLETWLEGQGASL